MGPVEPAGGGMSRRTMLKGIGAGTAVAWAAPALTTVGRAVAQTSPVCTECGPGGNCGAQPPCGGTCTCLERIEPRAGCFCHQPVSCRNPNVRACTTDADCRPGWACTRSCCAGGEPRCHPPCDTDLGGAQAAPTSVG